MKWHRGAIIFAAGAVLGVVLTLAFARSDRSYRITKGELDAIKTYCAAGRYERRDGCLRRHLGKAMGIPEPEKPPIEDNSFERILRDYRDKEEE